MSTLYLKNRGGVAVKHGGFTRPMYTDVDEIINLMRISVRQATGKITDSFRTLYSGVVEEYVVVETSHNGKTLLFRLWPVFYSHDKRIEYIIYSRNQNLQDIVRHYLAIFSKANKARLVRKN